MADRCILTRLFCWRCLARFRSEERGSVAIIFGLTSVTLFAMIGVAIDYARFANARNQTIAATDATVLAATRALQTNGGDQGAAIALAKAYYSQAVQNRIGVVDDKIDFAVSDNATA